jgi:hypothetical protein
MLGLGWLFNNSYQGVQQNRGDLVDALAKAPHEYYFSTDLVVTLIESFWGEYRDAMIWRAFMPFLFYFFSVIAYFVYYLPEPIP